jgi:hypothetical protein
MSDEMSVLEQVVRGKFRRGPGGVQWKTPSSKLTVFISSTFTDTHCERNILQERIAPLLRARGREFGLEIIFIDMRYGVRNENTMDHTTWLQCSNLLQWCAEESAGLFFISLQADKYGSCFVPRTISENVFEKLVGCECEETRQVATEWFRRDDNACPPQYVLRPLTDVNDPHFWGTVLPLLTRALDSLPISDAHPDHLVGQSVTEWEVRSALSLNHNHFYNQQGSLDDGIGWAHRSCNEILPEQDPGNKVIDYRDDPGKEQRFKQLLSRMTSEISSDKITTFNLAGLKDYATESYEARWEATMTEGLTCLLGRLISKKKSFDRDGGGLGLPGPALLELLHHAAWADNKCAHFFGREELLENAMHLLLSTPFDNAVKSSHANEKSVNLYGCKLCLCGKSGVGKTAVMVSDALAKQTLSTLLLSFLLASSSTIALDDAYAHVSPHLSSLM